MKILIPLEISARELQYKVYLCHLLALNGFECFLGKKGYIAYLMKKEEGYIYFDKGYHDGFSDDIYKLVRSRNGYIVTLDEEGAIDFAGSPTLLKRYSKTVFQSIDQIFIWGKSQYDLIKEKIDNPEKVMITGHPRFEMLKTQYHIFYKDEVKLLKEKYKNFILVNTNMGFGNNIKGDAFVKDVNVGYGTWHSNIEDIINYDKLKMKKYVSLAKGFYPNYDGNIIFRPHPEEDFSYYIKAFNNYPRIIVINSGSVIPWIIASELMIHPDCTTAIESLLLGKKPISFLPYTENKSIITDLPVRVSHKIENIDELISFIRNKEYLKLEINLVDKEILQNNFSSHLDSSKLIVKQVAQLFKGQAESNGNGINLNDRLYLKYRSLKFMVDRSKPAKLLRKKLSGFNANNVKTIHNQCCILDNNFSKVTFDKLTNQLYHFIARDSF